MTNGLILLEPQHDKTNKMTCAPSEDLDQSESSLGAQVILLVLSCCDSFARTDEFTRCKRVN